MPVLIALAALAAVVSFIKMHPKDQGEVLGTNREGK